MIYTDLAAHGISLSVRAGLVCETPASGKTTRCCLVGCLVRADSVIFFFELFDQPYVIRRESSPALWLARVRVRTELWG